MLNEKLIKKYLPLTQTTYYILISLTSPLHGYGIMQKVEELSAGEVSLGPGTLYGALGKLEKDGLIKKISEEENERRKSYILTEIGMEISRREFERLKTLVTRTEHIFASEGYMNEEKGI
ncbi:PadR family transcriptional regulator [Heyndrickxia camelliae]|uniref:PadR family transcriptional regulator n=1 Tax=Heyndrickxia camelliae TaxID=1707093 RepID=A0A2N3LIY0_9BACI|nr:PadR family transcriptional regulator [Heyndrickxia camelliae]PKR84493.1 PadR family transcriptional regulator [Heyndrickxia camelliae]